MLAVSKEFRRKNIGTHLFEKFIQNCISDNIHDISLEVKTDNISAILFYKKHGFKVIDEAHGFYQNGENAYIMEKNI